MSIMTDAKARYESHPEIVRQYALAQAMIELKSYRWGTIDKVAIAATEADVAAFCRIIEALNEAKKTEA